MTRSPTIQAAAINAKHTERYDTLWRRLPWTGPVTILIWALGLWVLSHAMTKTAHVPERIPPADARFIELPEPPVPPLPVARTDPSVKRPLDQAAPAAKPETVTAPLIQQSVPDTTQSTNAAPQNAIQVAAASVPNNTTYATRYLGTAIRTEAVGVVAPPHGLTVLNEETPFDDDGSGNGWSPGGWVQESDACIAIMGKEGPCDGPVFAQPSAPWCYNADPFHPWEIGTCKRDLDSATVAYKRGDYAAAFAQFKKLAEKDYAPAQSNVGMMYAEGIGVAKDEQQAVYWWRKAAKEGDTKAIYNLALMYSDGKGVAKDDQQAAYWYQKAAYFGYEFAQYNLGVMYAKGTGVPQDDKQAAYWYRKAANKGNAIAQYNLGVMYADGIGVPGDDKQAVYWYCKAATRGHANAKSSLAQMYSANTEAPKEGELAYFCWLLSSAKRSAQNAYKDRSMFTKMLSFEQRTNAEAAAKIWQSR